jgi:hypothetical protein
LNAKTKVTTFEQRLKLASDILAQAANPLTINQGKHNTCAFAAIESRTYTRHPRAAADLIRQIATTGKYLTARGQKISIDPSNIAPDSEATAGGYGARSYASQLFQITSANVFWQSQGKDPRGIECPVGSIRYVQKPISLIIPNDTGERLLIEWEDGCTETVVSDSGRPVCEPCVALGDVQQVGALVAERDDDVFVIASKKFDRTQKYIAVKSVDDLRKKLIESRNHSNLPLIAAVDSTCGWFKRDPNLQRFAGGWFTLSENRGPAKQSLTNTETNTGWHVVCITDYNPHEDTVSIDNFWGPHADHIGNNSMPITDLYSAINAQ